MRRDRQVPWLAVAGAALVVAVIAVVVVTVRGGRDVPDGPVTVVWNRESCAHCRMAIGDPRYAAQLVTADGTVANFDDVGCLLRYLDEHHPRVHRLWFHHPTADRWLAPAEVGFTPGATTPMGWGLVATERVTAPGPTTLDLDAARAFIAARDGGTPAEQRP